MFFTPPAVAPPTFTPATPAVAPAQVSKANPAPYGWQTYTVRPGDSVYTIAARFKTTTSAIVSRNKLSQSGRVIHSGQSLQVPRTSAKPVAAKAPKTTPRPATRRYVVKSGDTLSAIAARYGTSMDTIARLTGLVSKMRLHPGQVLVLPASSASTTSAGSSSAATAPKAKAAAKAPAKKAPSRTTKSIRVRTGDTLWALAQSHKTSVASLMKTNALSSSTIRVGQTLRVTTAAPAKQVTKKNNSFAGRTYPDATVSAAETNRNMLSTTSTPSRTQVKAMIITTAKRHGVDPKLALAIGWQESGWDQKQVSVANAIGVMQVIPDSGKWASSMVGRDLNLRNAQDNITAGVVILRALHRMADNGNDAIAGYYQGLGSVQSRGMYSDTVTYVRNINALRARM